jgi:hypothetical protein
LIDRYDEMAAHEAGHAVVAVATGLEIEGIYGVSGQHPTSNLVGAERAYFVKYRNFTSIRDPRFGFLILVGGFAGETISHKSVHYLGAMDDLDKLKRKGKLPDILIQELTGVAIEIIDENRKIWDEIRKKVSHKMRLLRPTLFEGAAIMARFKQIGKSFNDLAKLEALVPIANMETS